MRAKSYGQILIALIKFQTLTQGADYKNATAWRVRGQPKGGTSRESMCRRHS